MHLLHVEVKLFKPPVPYVLAYLIEKIGMRISNNTASHLASREMKYFGICYRNPSSNGKDKFGNFKK